VDGGDPIEVDAEVTEFALEEAREVTREPLSESKHKPIRFSRLLSSCDCGTTKPGQERRLEEVPELRLPRLLREAAEGVRFILELNYSFVSTSSLSLYISLMGII